MRAGNMRLRKTGSICIIGQTSLHGPGNWGFTIRVLTGGVNTINADGKLPLGGITEANLIVEDITIPASPVVVAGTISETSVGSYVFTYGTPISAGKTIRVQGITYATNDFIELGYDLKDLTLRQAPTVSA